ncbi:hypothetical protein GCM10027347_56990 [Larkinella harenae]
MKSLFSFWVIVLAGANGYGQDQSSIAFLHDFFGQSAQITYLDKFWESELTNLQKALARDTLQDAFKTKRQEPADYLKLTRQERSHIQRELRLLPQFSWTSQLFKSGKLLNMAALERTIRGYSRDDKELKKQYGSRYYSFSKPIFIRNHSVCIFYVEYSCFSMKCGEGKLMVFKQTKTGWVPWMELYKWIS